MIPKPRLYPGDIVKLPRYELQGADVGWREITKDPCSLIPSILWDSRRDPSSVNVRVERIVADPVNPGNYFYHLVDEVWRAFYATPTWLYYYGEVDAPRRP